MNIKNWTVFFIIAGYHLLLLLLLPWFVGVFSWPAMGLFLATYVVGGLSITAGYHRLYAHKTYSAHPAFEWLLLLGSILALQGSARTWTHDHRLHHTRVDTDDDPYSINKGIWYAHMGWIFSYQRVFEPKMVRDLDKNPRVIFQDRYYLPLALAVNAAVVAVGCLFMHPLAAFYAGFLLRVFMIHHSTWFINSLAHVWGSKTFAKELSAVDNAVLAFLTFGEGYHNYHHAFAGDYRNGVRWYHFDPTKWLIWTASRLGLAKELRSIHRIYLQRTLVMKDKQLLTPLLKSHWDELATEIHGKLEYLDRNFQEKADRLMAMLGELQTASTEKRLLIRREVRRLKHELKATWKDWVAISKFTAQRYQLARAHSSY